MTELEILRGRLAAAEAGVEILTQERDEARAEARRLGRLVAAMTMQAAGMSCALTRTRARLARVLRLTDAWSIPTGHPRGRVWSRRLAP